MTWNEARPICRTASGDDRLPLWPVAAGAALVALPVVLLLAAPSMDLPGLALAPLVLLTVSLCAALPVTISCTILYAATMLAVEWIRSKERRSASMKVDSILKQRDSAEIR